MSHLRSVRDNISLHRRLVQSSLCLLCGNVKPQRLHLILSVKLSWDWNQVVMCCGVVVWMMIGKWWQMQRSKVKSNQITLPLSSDAIQPTHKSEFQWNCIAQLKLSQQCHPRWTVAQLFTCCFRWCSLAHLNENESRWFISWSIGSGRRCQWPAQVSRD